MTYDEIMARLYPEVAAGGYSRTDGTVEFYSRVQSLLTPDTTVLDLGAGRGRWHENSSPWRRRVTDLRGENRTVVGVDPDPAVLENQSVDKALVMPDPTTIPLDDSSVDVVVANWVLEHVPDPGAISAEIDRVLVPGGWLCAQTPNRRGYIALAARLVPNAAHVPVLSRAQPDREARDVFPTYYRMNRPEVLKSFFPGYAHVVYGYQGPPMYMGSSVTAYRVAKAVLSVLPEGLAASLLVFFQKPEANLG